METLANEDLLLQNIWTMLNFVRFALNSCTLCVHSV